MNLSLFLNDKYISVVLMKALLLKNPFEKHLDSNFYEINTNRLHLEHLFTFSGASMR
jgi:hypothetical protein